MHIYLEKVKSVREDLVAQRFQRNKHDVQGRRNAYRQGSWVSKLWGREGIGFELRRVSQQGRKEPKLGGRPYGVGRDDELD